jgi:hypothetical protein
MRLAIIVVLTLAVVSPAFAILRPRFPLKPLPPFSGQYITIEDGSIQNPPKHPGQASAK